MKSGKIFKLIGYLGLLIFLMGCGSDNTVTMSMDQDEFNQQKFLCQEYGLWVDFQPGKMVCSGEYQGEQVTIEIIAEAVDGNGLFKIVRFSQGDEEIGMQQLAELNKEMEQDMYIYPDEKYSITSIEITEDELIINSVKK